MKTLFLMRHAKSSWDDPTVSDFDRPLNERGTRTAPFMGKFMLEKGLEPSIIISSPAVRAMETARIVKESAGLLRDIQFDGRIYEASQRALLEVASELDDTFPSAMLIGHNPGLEGFIRLLTDEIVPVPTASLAVIDLNIITWNRTAAGCGRLLNIFRPKEIAVQN